MTYFAGSFIPLWACDRFGRRALLMFSAAGLCFCFAVVSILLSRNTVECAYGAIAFIFLFQIFLGIGYLPIPWFYPSEVTTTRIRSKGQAFGGFVNWMCVFCVVQITPIAIENINWHIFIIFACFCAMWIPIVYFFFPGKLDIPYRTMRDLLTCYRNCRSGTRRHRSPLREGRYHRRCFPRKRWQNSLAWLS